MKTRKTNAARPCGLCGRLWAWDERERPRGLVGAWGGPAGELCGACVHRLPRPCACCGSPSQACIELTHAPQQPARLELELALCTEHASSARALLAAWRRRQAALSRARDSEPNDAEGREAE